MKGASMERHASVSLRRGQVYVQSKAQTVNGVYRIGRVVGASAVSDLVNIGKHVRLALEGFRAGLPHEVDSGEDIGSYESFGVKSWREYIKGVKYVTVRQVGQTLELVPWRNQGARRGFVPTKNHDVIISNYASDIEIGAALLEALAAAE